MLCQEGNEGKEEEKEMNIINASQLLPRLNGKKLCALISDKLGHLFCQLGLLREEKRLDVLEKKKKEEKKKRRKKRKGD